MFVKYLFPIIYLVSKKSSSPKFQGASRKCWARGWFSRSPPPPLWGGLCYEPWTDRVVGKTVLIPFPGPEENAHRVLSRRRRGAMVFRGRLRICEIAIVIELHCTMCNTDSWMARTVTNEMSERVQRSDFYRT